jgi:hypothetical protein
VRHLSQPIWELLQQISSKQECVGGKRKIAYRITEIGAQFWSSNTRPAFSLSINTKRGVSYACVACDLDFDSCSERRGEEKRGEITLRGTILQIDLIPDGELFSRSIQQVTHAPIFSSLSCACSWLVREADRAIHTYTNLSTSVVSYLTYLGFVWDRRSMHVLARTTHIRCTYPPRHSG